MFDIEYLTARAHEELKAAIAASDQRVRDVHLEFADAYSYQVREAQAWQRRCEMQLVATAKPGDALGGAHEAGSLAKTHMNQN